MTGQPLIFRRQPPGTATRHFPLGPDIPLMPPRRFHALAPQCLNRGFAATHTPFIPPAPQRRNPWLAALAAKGITAHLDTHLDYDVIWVPKASAHRARMELIAYENVNENWPPKTDRTETCEDLFRHDALCACLLVQAAMVRFHLVLARSGHMDAWEERGMWNPQAILDGQWWRCLTALTLHQNLAHVTANACWGLIFGTLASTQLGTGSALLLMLLTGALGNATMVVLGGTHHSLGASTMVFGLLGILAAVQTIRKWRKRLSGKGLFRIMPAIPLAFALGLGALQGAAPGADALAHACGFAWGLVLGALAYPARTAKLSITIQLTAALLAGASLTVAWQLAWRG